MLFQNISLLLLLGTAAGAADSSNNNVLRRSLQTNDELDEAVTCNKAITSVVDNELDFLVVEGDAVGLAVEDDIRADLAKIGINVKLIKVSKEEWNTRTKAGDFSMCFTETWGNPYDPHSYSTGWIAGDEGHFAAFENFDSPSSRDELFEMLEDVFKEADVDEQKKQWAKIHQYYHEQAVMLPLFGKRIPTLMNPRLSGYEAGYQQFDYPVQNLVPNSGSSTVTIAPGAQTGMFQSVGRLDPHTYRPNEFFANNWVYEGLIGYGEGGQLLPALAKSWSISDNDIGGETITFTLRDGVKFHDGEDWNCPVAKLNFDHVFAGALVSGDYHGWYNVPLILEDWKCEDDMTFVLTTTLKYGPFLQELSYIRPLRMLSPAAFAEGLTTDPFTQNSCHAGWGTVTADGFEDVTCVGIGGKVSGTGPFVFDNRVSNLDDEGEATGKDDSVTFMKNTDYWGGAPAIDLKVVRYDTTEDVKAALLDGSLDVIWGAGVLADKDIVEIRDDASNDIQVFLSDDVQNNLMLLNSGRPPLDSIDFRRTVIHAINKKAIVEKELLGLNQVANQVFSKDAPFSDLILEPVLEYDLEKAIEFTKKGCSPVTLCLPSETMVTEQRRGDIALSDLEIGDYIHTGDNKYERVYSFGHKRSKVTANYLSMVVEGLDRPVELSPDHMVFVNNDVMPASSIRVGDSLYVGTKNVLREVTKITNKTKRGAFAPFTPSGKFVANGVIVSSYVTLNDSSHVLGGLFSSQWLANIFESPHRLVCALNFNTCRNEQYDADGISTWVAGPRRFFLWVLEQHVMVQAMILTPVFTVAAVSWMVENMLSGTSIIVTMLSLAALLGWKKEFGKQEKV